MSMNESLLLIATGLLVAYLLSRSFLSRREAERLAAEEAAGREAERMAEEEAASLAAEDAARREAERLAAEDVVRREAERLATVEAAYREAERLAAEDAARREAERLATEVAAYREAERLAAEDTARLEAERLAAEDAARREAERLAAEDAARRVAERLAAEDAVLRAAERLAAEESCRRETERMVALEALLHQEEAKAQALSAPSEAVVLKAKSAEQTVVMVADDSKVVRIKTGRLLTANKYQVLMAEDGLDAAKQIENSIPDLLITDVDMPGMSGFQLVRHLRSSPRTIGIPIIMVTSDSEVLRTEALESGVNVLLGKPYPEEQLISHIQRLVVARTEA